MSGLATLTPDGDRPTAVRGPALTAVAAARPRARVGPTVLWRVVVCLVIAKTAWDTLGLLAGDVTYRGPAYDVLRSLPPVGGMRVRGVVLGLLLAALFVAARRLACCGDGRMLRLCLTGVAVWYMAWSAGIASAWLYHDQVLGWSAPAAVLVVAILALRAARTTPALRRGV